MSSFTETRESYWDEYFWSPLPPEECGAQEGCWVLDSVVPRTDVDTLDAAGYAYDKVGNRTDNGASISGGNRMTGMHGWALTYDASGNLLKRKKGLDSLTYAWNALGQLVKVTSTVSPGYTVTYGYDGLGRRIRKSVNGDTTYFLLDGNRVMVELDEAWAPAAKYSYYPGTDRPHAMVRGGAVYYFTQDAQGNVTGLVNATGGAAQTYYYGAYGERRTGTGSVVNPYQFKGREWDAEAQLYFMRARYYDPLIGRFISEDPIGLAGGINPTVFAGADPVNNADPSGLSCVPASEGRQFCPIIIVTPKDEPDRGNDCAVGCGGDRPDPGNPKCDAGPGAQLMAGPAIMAASCTGGGAPPGGGTGPTGGSESQNPQQAPTSPQTGPREEPMSMRACIDGTPGFLAAYTASPLALFNLKPAGLVRPGASEWTSIDRLFPRLPGSSIDGGIDVRRVGSGAVKTAGRYGTITAVVSAFATSYAATTIARCAIPATRY